MPKHAKEKLLAFFLKTSAPRLVDEKRKQEKLMKTA